MNAAPLSHRGRRSPLKKEQLVTKLVVILLMQVRDPLSFLVAGADDHMVNSGPSRSVHSAPLTFSSCLEQSRRNIASRVSYTKPFVR